MTAHNKFGVHYVVDGSHDGYGADLERSAAAGQPFGLVKSFFDKGALGQAKSVSRNTFTIYRVSIDDNDFPPTENGSWYWPNDSACKQSAIDWIHSCAELWKGEEANVDAYEFINEPNPTDEKIYWFIEWSRYCLDEAERLGYRLAWGGFSTGTPTESQMVQMLPFVGEIALRGHILAMHDGSVGDPFTFQGTATDPNSEQANSSLRYRWWKRQADLQGLPFPEVAITECYAYGEKTTSFYDDWRWYLTELAKDDYLIGVAWYTLGNGGEFGNIAGKPMQRVVDKSLEIDYGAIEPTPPPPVVQPIIVDVPFLSQTSITANLSYNDCGSACEAMCARRLGDTHTVNDWYVASGAGLGYISIAELVKAATSMGYTLNVLLNQSLDSLRTILDSGNPAILLVNPVGLQNCGTTAPHFIVAMGYSKESNSFYCHDPYFLAPGVGGAMIEQTTLVEAWGRCHEQSNPDFLCMVMNKNISPTAEALSGVGMGNLAVLTSPELDCLRIGKVHAFKALTLQHPPNNAALVDQVRSVNPDIFIMARLMFPSDSDNKTKFTPQQFVDYVLPPALVMYDKGVEYYEIHNEPNLFIEGWSWNWVNGIAFGNWFNEVCAILRNSMPNAKFGFPGLSPQADRTLWCEASNQFYLDAKDAINAADWLGVHSYWQDRGTGYWQMDSTDGGMYWKVIQSMYPNKPLYLTEYSCNNPNISDSDKGKMYAEYIEKLQGIQVAFSFCLSWVNDPSKESWVRNNVVTDIPIELGRLLV